MTYPHNPSWLQKIVDDRPHKLGTLNQLNLEKESSASTLPWLLFLNRIAAEKNLKMDEIVLDICQNNNSLYPTHLSIYPKTDLSLYFPEHLAEEFGVIPFNVTGICLSLAVIEPDNIVPLYHNYVTWAKEGAKMSVLQFFLTTPSAWLQYKERSV